MKLIERTLICSNKCSKTNRDLLWGDTGEMDGQPAPSIHR